MKSLALPDNIYRLGALQGACLRPHGLRRVDLLRTRIRKCERCGKPADYCVLYRPVAASREDPYLAQRCSKCLADTAGERVGISSHEVTQKYER